MSVIPGSETILPANGRYTADDLLILPDADKYELVDGELQEIHVGQKSSWVATALAARMFNHCEAHKLGWLQGSDAAYQCFPGRPNLVRRPDVSFVKFGRFPGEELPDGHAKLAPDLAAEVVSPNDLAEEIMEKVRNYLSAGVRLVWVVYPQARLAQIYRLDGSLGLVRAEQELNGEDAVPGFACRLDEILPPQSSGK